MKHLFRYIEHNAKTARLPSGREAKRFRTLENVVGLKKNPTQFSHNFGKLVEDFQVSRYPALRLSVDVQ